MPACPAYEKKNGSSLTITETLEILNSWPHSSYLVNSELFPASSPIPSDFCFLLWSQCYTMLWQTWTSADTHMSCPSLSSVSQMSRPHCAFGMDALGPALSNIVFRTKCRSNLNTSSLSTQTKSGARTLGDFLPGCHHTSGSSASLRKHGSQLSLPIHYIYQPWQREAWTLIAIWRADCQRSSKASLSNSIKVDGFFFRLWTNTFYSIYF